MRTFTPGAMKLLRITTGRQRARIGKCRGARGRAFDVRTWTWTYCRSIRSKEIVRGSLQLSNLLPPLPGEAAGAHRPIIRTLPFSKHGRDERRIIVDMLERTNWNQTEAANDS